MILVFFSESTRVSKRTVEGIDDFTVLNSVADYFSVSGL
jgi:hypothetical protein